MQAIAKSSLIFALLCVISVGCRQAPNAARPSLYPTLPGIGSPNLGDAAAAATNGVAPRQSLFPWLRRPAAVAQQPADNAAVPDRPILSRLRSRSSPLIGELQQRADDQTRLASQQEKRLADLREWQKKYERDQLALLERERRRKQELEKRKLVRNDKELLAQREKLKRYGEIRQRAGQLDESNRDLNAQLARSQQRIQLLEDQMTQMRQRVNAGDSTIVALREREKKANERLQTFQASTSTSPKRRRAAIEANNSLKKNLRNLSIPGLSVREDADLIRIDLPADELFVPGTARLCQDALPYLTKVAEVLGRDFGQQVIGVEAHTDSNPLANTLWRNHHQLTAAQSMAVFEQLVQRFGMSENQLFVLGHGKNHPIASNATAAGQTKNRRVEIVVYPERMASR